MSFRFILKALTALIVAAAIAFAALQLYGWDRVWAMTAGPADLGPVSFDGLEKGPKPNQALICPPDLCNAQSVDRQSPVYALGADRLKDELLQSLEAENDLERVDDQSDPMKMRFVQRTKLMRFPDTIRVRIIPIDDNSSTLAIYSQSQIGESDFGVNLERANRWLSRLEEFRK